MRPESLYFTFCGFLYLCSLQKKWNQKATFCFSLVNECIRRLFKQCLCDLSPKYKAIFAWHYCKKNKKLMNFFYVAELCRSFSESETTFCCGFMTNAVTIHVLVFHLRKLDVCFWFFSIWGVPYSLFSMSMGWCRRKKGG